MSNNNTALIQNVLNISNSILNETPPNETFVYWSNFILLCLAFVFIFSIIFNIISILSITSTPLTPINLLILNLAISDLFYSFGIPMFSITYVTENWIFGQFGCNFFFFIEFSSIISSVLTVTFLSVERFFDVTDFAKKRKYRLFTKQKVLIYIATLWMIAIAFIAPMISSISLTQVKNKYICVSNWSGRQFNIFFMTKFTFVFIFPYIIICISSIKLLIYLNEWGSRTKNRTNLVEHLKLNDKGNFKEETINEKTENASHVTCFLTPKNENFLSEPSWQFNHIENSSYSLDTESATRSQGLNQSPVNLPKEKSLKESLNGVTTTTMSEPNLPNKTSQKRIYVNNVRKKAVRLVLTIVFFFLMQWSPFWIFQIYQIIATEKIKNVQFINLVTSSISYTNTVANPILYMILTYNFKLYLKKNFNF